MNAVEKIAAMTHPLVVAIRMIKSVVVARALDAKIERLLETAAR